MLALWFLAGILAGTGESPPAPPVIEWIGDGVGRGSERAAKERLDSERDLRAIIARAFDSVTKTAPPETTPAEKQAVAKKAFQVIERDGFDITLREIERLVKQFARQARGILEDDDMMVLLLT